MKHLDENTIAAYIDGKLNEKETKKVEKIIAKSKEYQQLLSEILSAKRIMGKGDNAEVPWQLTSLVKDEIDKMFTSKATLIIKLIKDGIQEIKNTLTGPKEALNYTVRGATQVAPLYHFNHTHEEMDFDIYTFFEDQKHIRVKLECKDRDGHNLNGQVSLIKFGNHLETRATKDGMIEFDNVEKGEYEISFEYKDILNPNQKLKKMFLFLTLN